MSDIAQAMFLSYIVGMNSGNFALMPTTGWQITLIVIELIAFACFAYLLIKKIRSKHPYTHFEGKLYWAAILILLFNFVFYIYRT